MADSRITIQMRDDILAAIHAYGLRIAHREECARGIDQARRSLAAAEETYRISAEHAWADEGQIRTLLNHAFDLPKETP